MCTLAVLDGLEHEGNLHSAGLDGFEDEGNVHSAGLDGLDNEGNVYSAALDGFDDEGSVRSSGLDGLDVAGGLEGELDLLLVEGFLRHLELVLGAFADPFGAFAADGLIGPTLTGTIDHRSGAARGGG
jgi:hypothetical protein